VSRLKPSRVPDLRITVTIPVGPEAHHQEWLGDCLESVVKQTRLPDEVLIIDDMAGLPAGLDHTRPFPTRIWHSPWLLGPAHAFNFGVALAENDLVFMLGADDLLAPSCIESCLAQYETNGRQDAYYYCPFTYGIRGVAEQADEDRLSKDISNIAMVTKGLWRKTGGFPIVAALGPCDYIMGAVLKKSGFLHVPVRPLQGHSLYWFRIHEQNQTRIRLREYPGWPYEMVRSLCYDSWKAPQWGRFS